MSAIAAPAPAGTPTPSETPEKKGMSKLRKVLLGLGAFYLLGLIFFIAVWGFKPHKQLNGFAPTDEFKLTTWFSAGPIDFNKGVLYVILAALITVVVLIYVAHRLKQRPGRLQAAVEMFYGLTSSMTNDSLHDQKMARKYFPLIASLFVFILVSNLIGYIPLPVDSLKFTVFGAHIPSFQIYAADTNVAFPLVLSLLVFGLFSWERLKYHHYNPIAAVKSLMPAGITGLQAFIFSILTAIYLGDAVTSH